MAASGRVRQATGQRPTGAASTPDLQAMTDQLLAGTPGKVFPLPDDRKVLAERAEVLRNQVAGARTDLDAAVTEVKNARERQAGIAKDIALQEAILAGGQYPDGKGAFVPMKGGSARLFSTLTPDQRKAATDQAAALLPVLMADDALAKAEDRRDEVAALLGDSRAELAQAEAKLASLEKEALIAALGINPTGEGLANFALANKWTYRKAMDAARATGRFGSDVMQRFTAWAQSQPLELTSRRIAHDQLVGTYNNDYVAVLNAKAEILNAGAKGQSQEEYDRLKADYVALEALRVEKERELIASKKAYEDRVAKLLALEVVEKVATSTAPSKKPAEAQPVPVRMNVLESYRDRLDLSSLGRAVYQGMKVVEEVLFRFIALGALGAVWHQAFLAGTLSPAMALHCLPSLLQLGLVFALVHELFGIARRWETVPFGQAVKETVLNRGFALRILQRTAFSVGMSYLYLYISAVASPGWALAAAASVHVGFDRLQDLRSQPSAAECAVKAIQDLRVHVPEGVELRADRLTPDDVAAVLRTNSAKLQSELLAAKAMYDPRWEVAAAVVISVDPKGEPTVRVEALTGRSLALPGMRAEDRVGMGRLTPDQAATMGSNWVEVFIDSLRMAGKPGDLVLPMHFHHGTEAPTPTLADVNALASQTESFFASLNGEASGNARLGLIMNKAGEWVLWQSHRAADSVPEATTWTSDGGKSRHLLSAYLAKAIREGDTIPSGHEEEPVSALVVQVIGLKPSSDALWKAERVGQDAIQRGGGISGYVGAVVHFFNQSPIPPMPDYLEGIVLDRATDVETERVLKELGLEAYAPEFFSRTGSTASASAEPLNARESEALAEAVRTVSRGKGVDALLAVRRGHVPDGLQDSLNAFAKDLLPAFRAYLGEIPGALDTPVENIAVHVVEDSARIPEADVRSMIDMGDAMIRAVDGREGRHYDIYVKKTSLAAMDMADCLMWLTHELAHVALYDLNHRLTANAAMKRVEVEALTTALQKRVLENLAKTPGLTALDAFLAKRVPAASYKHAAEQGLQPKMEFLQRLAEALLDRVDHAAVGARAWPKGMREQILGELFSSAYGSTQDLLSSARWLLNRARMTEVVPDLELKEPRVIVTDLDSFFNGAELNVEFLTMLNALFAKDADREKGPQLRLVAAFNAGDRRAAVLKKAMKDFGALEASGDRVLMAAVDNARVTPISLKAFLSRMGGEMGLPGNFNYDLVTNHRALWLLDILGVVPILATAKALADSIRTGEVFRSQA